MKIKPIKAKRIEKLTIKYEAVYNDIAALLPELRALVDIDNQVIDNQVFAAPIEATAYSLFVRLHRLHRFLEEMEDGQVPSVREDQSV